MAGFDCRAWLERARHLWSASLQLRTVAVTVLLLSLAAGIVGGYMALSVGANLFDSRRDELTAISQNATIAGQRVFDGSLEQPAEDFEVIVNDAAGAILAAA